MEEKKFKTLEDFLAEGKTESEYWTYYVINEEEINAAKEEKEDKKEYPYLIVKCLNCGTIIDETKTKPDITLSYEKRIRCKCGKMKFKVLNEKERKELNKKSKSTNNLSEYRIKRYIERIEIDLEKVKNELDEDLENGKISNERYLVLMVELIEKERKYYEHYTSKKFDFKNFRDMATEVAKAELEKKYNCEILDEKVDEIVKSYDEERDNIFLEKNEIMLRGKRQVEDEAGIKEELEKIDLELERIEKLKNHNLEIERKISENKKDIEKKYSDRLQDNEIWEFKKTLKRELRKN